MMKKSRQPTIHDVAENAGVSIKTVSRVLNNEGNVTPETRSRVVEAIRVLNYRPNISARSLSGQRSYLIGLIYDNPSMSYMTNVIMGVMTACKKHGHHLIIEEVDGKSDNIVEAVSELALQSAADGVVLIQPICNNVDVLASLRSCSTPFVCIAPDDVSDALLSVRMDDYQAAYDLTEYLISLGHKDIAFIKGPADYYASRIRFNGFKDALIHHGLSINSEYIVQGAFSYRSGLECAEQLLSYSSKRPTAIFAGNDDMAAAVIATAHKLDIDVPGEISVAGFDDSPMASTIWPQLTTIHQPITDMASAAVDLLIDRAGGKGLNRDDREERLLSFKLMIRQSTAPPKR